MILSASRRTDLPGYYSEWLMNRLKEGFVYYRNPMNHAQLCRVELTPEVIDCIVFWTKDPANMMDKLDLLDAMGYGYYFQFTLTPYGLTYHGIKDNRFLEPNLRDKADIIRTFRELSVRLGPDRVLWRYDPIIFNTTLTMKYHEECFGYLCEALSGYTRLCTISFADVYSKLSNIVKQQVLCGISSEEMHHLAAAFVKIAKEYGISVRACCEADDFSKEGVYPASCIDRETVEKVCGHPMKLQKDRNQRLNCGCLKSIDIGAYNTCRNGCVYCYANHSLASIEKNCTRHDLKSPIMIGTLEQEE